ncbi:hypothetical protein J6590_102325 [Homalodisca vitripennis]|nr:hypothetical protein J6590_102325 [Homalodisca vitripennis]
MTAMTGTIGTIVCVEIANNQERIGIGGSWLIRSRRSSRTRSFGGGLNVSGRFTGQYHRLLPSTCSKVVEPDQLAAQLMHPPYPPRLYMKNTVRAGQGQTWIQNPRGPVLTRLTRLGILARPGLARCSRSSDTPAQYTLPDQGHRSGWLLHQYMTSRQSKLTSTLTGAR